MVGYRRSNLQAANHFVLTMSGFETKLPQKVFCSSRIRRGINNFYVNRFNRIKQAADELRA
jgi:hypothetical protein